MRQGLALQNLLEIVLWLPCEVLRLIPAFPFYMQDERPLVGDQRIGQGRKETGKVGEMTNVI